MFSYLLVAMFTVTCRYMVALFTVTCCRRKVESEIRNSLLCLGREVTVNKQFTKH